LVLISAVRSAAAATDARPRNTPATAIIDKSIFLSISYLVVFRVPSSQRGSNTPVSAALNTRTVAI
jgi:hypothetical protein